MIDGPVSNGYVGQRDDSHSAWMEQDGMRFRHNLKLVNCFGIFYLVVLEHG